MNKTILVIYGESQYSVLCKATDLVILGFQRKGYQVEILRMDDADKMQHLDEILSKEYAFIFSIQALLFELNNANAIPIVSLMETPWFGWIVDDILYHLHKVMNNQYENTYILGVDNRMKEYAQLMFPGMDHVVTVYHGGFECKHHDGQKDMDILFSGTDTELKSFEESVENPMPVELFLVQESEKILSENPQIGVRTALKQVLMQMGEELNTDLILELSRVIFYLDGYVRYQCRTKILYTLLEAGFHIHILGNGYDEIKKQYPNQITHYGAVEIDEVTEMMSRSKIVMNPFPPIFEQGFHERIFSAMLCKSICFTPESDFLRQQLGERVEYIDLNNMEQMVLDIQSVLDNYDKQQERLEDNYQYAFVNHTWEKRGEEIIDFYESGCGLQP
ncbi:MAG: hypothetical protein Q4D51_00630 [Eubacteriales bacterium]|nr:hypothetical protein [Eubacteriales bacterium]